MGLSMYDIFDKIINKEVPSTIEYEDEEIIAFHDIAPIAPVHILIIPKEHRIESAGDITEKDTKLIGRLILRAKEIAQKLGINESGYRLVFNVGNDGGAVIQNHIHLHLIGGKKLGKEA